MTTRLRRKKLKLTKRKQRKTHRIKSTIKKTRRFRKKTHKFRKGKKQYGGKFNEEEIEEIRYALRQPDANNVNKGFTEAEIDDFIRRINVISQDLSDSGEFREMVIPQLQENNKETIMDWLEFNEDRLRDVEPMTDKGESDMGTPQSSQSSQGYQSSLGSLEY